MQANQLQHRRSLTRFAARVVQGPRLAAHTTPPTPARSRPSPNPSKASKELRDTSENTRTPQPPLQSPCRRTKLL
ncbi:hypothetical protein N431DRAFT_438175 [Stipitochalara longipes BDJ]|nr:hypothetical protein N431DRAFT_438175 [Stipitochalara longipes BDJ]